VSRSERFSDRYPLAVRSAQDGTGSKYRETPVPADLAASTRALADVCDEAADTPLVDRSPRTIRRWVTTAGARLYADTGDDGWTYLGPHDLRRTWGTLLVEPGLVMEWGGWEDWETFREHYLGGYSLDAQQRGMEKVDWL
jgi:integrase